MSTINSTVKFCPKCQTETERKSNGLCRPCVNAYARAYSAAHPEAVRQRNLSYRTNNKDKLKHNKSLYYAANVDKVKATVAAYKANHPDKVKTGKCTYYANNRDKAGASGKAYRIGKKHEIKAHAAVYYAANREKVKEKVSSYRQSHPEVRRVIEQNREAKKRKNGGRLSLGLSAKLFKLQKGKCACCGLPLGDNYHLDHIMPIHLGGPNTDDNIQLLRPSCNSQKHAKHPVDFMQSRGFLL